MMSSTDDRIWVADMTPSDRYPLYTRGNVGEVFPHVMSALGGTLMGEAVGRSQMEVFRRIGFVTTRDLDGDTLGTGVFGGYLYGSASLARLMGRRTPGMKATDADEQVFGRLDDLPPYIPTKGDRNVLASCKLMVFLASVMRRPDLSELDTARAAALTWIAASPDLHAATDEELIAYVHEYPARLAANMQRLLWFSMIGAARVLLDRVLDRAGVAAGTATRLVSGIDDVDSARIGQAQWDLSRVVVADPELTAIFDRGATTDDIVGTALERPLRDFLDRFGHRANDEYELAVACWSMEPAPVLASIERLRHVTDDRRPSVALARLVADRETAEREVRSRLRPPLRAFALKAAAVTRAGAVGRERAKDILVLESLGARRALHELVRRAATRGGPADPRHAFCITIDELPDYLADPSAFAEIIATRLELQQYLDARVPPLWFDRVLPHPSTWPLRSDPPAEAITPGAVLSGIAVSAGRATGRARVVHDPGDPRGLEPGEILVCAITDPSWTPLFLVAAAVVCDTGAMMSHAAIVARELGIPAVMSVRDITSVNDGTMISVDGDTGCVSIL